MIGCISGNFIPGKDWSSGVAKAFDPSPNPCTLIASIMLIWMSLTESVMRAGPWWLLVLPPGMGISGGLGSIKTSSLKRLARCTKEIHMSFR